MEFRKAGCLYPAMSGPVGSIRAHRNPDYLRSVLMSLVLTFHMLTMDLVIL